MIGSTDELTPQEIASTRWKMIEAANSAPGLPALARRVLIHLVCVMDAKERICFPSEEHIAAFLDADLTSVKKAKAKLKEAGLIDWSKPRGPRGQCFYTFDWSKLVGLRDEARAKASKAVESRRDSRPQGGLQATLGIAVEKPKVAVAPSQGGQISVQGGLQATSKVVCGPPYTTLYLPNGSSSHHAPSVRDDIDPLSPESWGTFKPPPQPSAPAASKGAQEGDSTPVKRPGPICRYPALPKEFADDKAVMGALAYLTADQEEDIARTLAMKGRDAARTMIMAGITSIHSIQPREAA